MHDTVKKIEKDLNDAKWAIIFIIACFASYYLFFSRYIYSLCPVRMITGFPCPFCGMSRAGFRLLRLDLAGAWEAHPFIYVLIILAFLFCLNRYFLKGEPLTKFLRYAAVLSLAALILFYLWRMITRFPGEPPMDYYANNLINRALSLLGFTPLFLNL